MVTTAVVAAAPTLAGAQTAEQPRAVVDDPNAPINISGEQMTGRPDREVTFKKDVEIIRGPTTINADQATYRMSEGEVEAHGNLRMKRFGDRYSGDELQMQIDSGVGFITHPTYKLQQRNAQGKAERIDFESRDESVVKQGTYSTCEGPDPDWYLQSSMMRLNKENDTGVATGSVVYFKGVPILGTPFISFPLSDARKSGVLSPTIGTTNTGGLEVMLPYYFNIAPERDLTLYPKLISKRGLQLGAAGRYLGATYNGETRVETLFNDQQTHTNRYALSSAHTQTFNQGRVGLGWNLNAASDDNYPTDFASTITTSSQRLLARGVALTYAGNFWSAAASATSYQVLQDLAAPIVRPYARLPQLSISAAKYDINGFDWSTDADFTRFWQPQDAENDRLYGRVNNNDWTRYPRVANRLIINPKLSFPIIHPGYFITPKLSLHASSYALEDAALGSPSNLTRVLPTLSLDSGMVFERDTTLFGKAATQTLEPRLFYVYTPYRDQSQFPLFDTGEADFNYGQLFSENRFIGNDRIGDANQVTAALVSRYIEASGAERARLAIGQRYYFTAPRVTLSPLTDPSRSDLLLAAEGRISQALSAEANMQYSQSQRNMVRSNYGVRWQPAPMHVLNLQYRRDLPNALEQVDFSAQWPLARRWFGVGRVNYSLHDKAVAEALAGLEYKADCWVFRVVAQRTPTSAQTATTGLFLQLELNGLSRIGSNPLEILRTSVPGYQKVN